MLAAFLALAAGRLGGQDGTLEWAVTLQGYSSSSAALSPDGGTVYVGVATNTAGHVVAVGADASLKWRRNLRGAVDSSPVVGPDGTVYVGSMDGRLCALNPTNGDSKWEFDTRTSVYSSPAIGADGTLYFGASDSRLHAVGSNGVERWSFPAGDWIDSSPAIGVDGTVYFGSRDKNVYAVGPDGVEKWRFGTGGRVDSSPALGLDGTVYVGSTDQRMYAIAPDGTKKWDYFTNGEIEASPVLGADGTVYFAANDTFFYALSADTGALRWRTSLNSTSVSTAAVRGDGMILFGADDGLIRALNPHDGSLAWRFDTKKTVTDDYIESSPLIAANGSIYFSSRDGRLYKLKGIGSPLSTLSSWPAFRRGVAHLAQATYVSNGGGRLLNLASRAQVAMGETLIAGFFVQGSSEKAYLVRGVGPTLAAFGVTGFMPDPKLDLYSGPVLLRSNDNWADAEPGRTADTADALGAFLLPTGSKDAAFVPALHPGSYTAHLQSVDGRSGVALVEVYDAIGGDPTGRLVNLSLRGRVGTGESVLIVGLAVGGTRPTRILVRAVGPGLAAFGVPEVLLKPSIEVYRGETLVRSNTGWTTQGLAYDLTVAAESVMAFPLAPGSADCAMILVADPGLYTMQVSGLEGTTGEALVETYVLR